jgi:IclR family transcriptional regulator, pca regulon regulatory protein
MNAMDGIEAGEANDRDYVASLARGLEVISAFTKSRPKMTLADIARSTGMNRATVRRLLLTLVREGYADKDDKLFYLKPKVLKLGYSAVSSMSMLDVIQPVMNELADKLQESVFAAVLAGEEVFYVARASADRLINVGITVGKRAPAFAVSTGRILLAAEPEEVRERYLDNVRLEKLTPNTVTSKVKLRALIEEARVSNYSIVDQEMEAGLGAISVPIRNGEGKVIAALNVCCPSSRSTIQDMQKHILPEMIAASQKISAAL